MSNEFVMVPREWVEGTVKAGAGEVLVLSDIATLAECLSQQPQGEPVAYARDWFAAGEIPYKEKNENGRIAWAKKFRFKEITPNKIFVTDVPLFTHADPGEVERLRGQINEWAGKWEKAINAGAVMEGERNTLRAQLAEAHDLLRGLDDAWNSHDGKEQFYKLMAKIEALSASAEPSDKEVNPAWYEVRGGASRRPCYGPNEWGTECGNCAKCNVDSAEPSAPDCDHCAGAGHDYYGKKCTHCMTSAPIDVDERAKFESAYPGLVGRVRWDEAKQEYRSGSKGLGWQEGLKATEWLAVWQARAALERKPS